MQCTANIYFLCTTIYPKYRWVHVPETPCSYGHASVWSVFFIFILSGDLELDEILKTTTLESKINVPVCLLISVDFPTRNALITDRTFIEIAGKLLSWKKTVGILCLLWSFESTDHPVRANWFHVVDFKRPVGSNFAIFSLITISRFNFCFIKS